MTKVKNFVFTFAERFSDCHTMTWAASVAFYTCFSLAPLVMISLAVVTNLGLELQLAFMNEVRSLVGPTAAQAMETVVRNANDRVDLRSLAGLLGTVTLVLSAGLIFGEMRAALTEILGHKVEEEELSFLHATITYLKSRLLQIGLAFGFIFAMMVSLLVTAVLNTVVRVGILEKGGGAFLVNIVLSVLVYILLFTGIFHFLPVPRLALRDAFHAGVITALLFVIGKEVVGLYLGGSFITSSYGAAGSIVVLLAWVYYSTLIVFIGAHSIYSWRKEISHAATSTE
ncbi:YihY/virulence factor BrkB family protein [Bdellovibrio bacteriovorus]|uniref:RNase BN n=1 Tax=Bdellovibrio bacteriovorus (strain ATCC 15356 / DSM 50701 / NCIMB 9529 / HD100) TaxID=264462 RepID=Q6MKY1_BDEBA|nr:YihY/virulence factor BrkB family protein [Bdellovibrio bacteriovorus]CAE80076.1 RNase BN [Bdellovibrio bacteriovorus HD100]